MVPLDQVGEPDPESPSDESPTPAPGPPPPAGESENENGAESETGERTARAVFLDTCERITRREIHRIEQGSAGPKFYESHRAYILGALERALGTICAATGASLSPGRDVLLKRVAEEITGRAVQELQAAEFADENRPDELLEEWRASRPARDADLAIEYLLGAILWT